MSGKIRNNLQLLERSVEIIDLISIKNSPVKFTKIVEETGISKPSVHRILSTLENFRIIVRDGNEGYIMGPRAIGWSRGYLQSRALLSVAKPWVDSIWKKVGETIHLVILEEDKAYYLYKKEGPHPLQMRSRVGDPIPLHSTAAGKAILFSLSKDRLDSFIFKKPLDKKTQNTIIDPEKLKKQLEKFLKRGFSEEVQENEEDIRCVAAPILSSECQPLGSVSITWPIYRCDDEKAKEVGSFLAASMQKISSELGYKKKFD